MSQADQNNLFPQPTNKVINPNQRPTYSGNTESESSSNIGFSFRDNNNSQYSSSNSYSQSTQNTSPNSNIPTFDGLDNQIPQSFNQQLPPAPQNQISNQNLYNQQQSQFAQMQSGVNTNSNPQAYNQYSQNQQNYNQGYNQQYNNYQPQINEEAGFVQPNLAPNNLSQKNILNDLRMRISKFRLPIMIIAGLLVLLLVGLFGVSQLSRLNKPVDTNPYTNVTATIDGPKNLPQGTPGRWDVKIVNNETVTLNDLTIDLKFDNDLSITQYLNYQPINQEKSIFKANTLSGIGQGQNSLLISFEGFLNAQVDLETMMQGKILYVPSPLVGKPNSQRQLEIAGLRTKIISPEVKLTIDPTNGSIQNGGEVEYVIKVKNTKEKDLQDLKLRLIYPTGNIFGYTSSQFTSSSTAQNKTAPDDGDDTWFLPRLAGLSEQTLTIKGILKVKSQQKVEFGAELSMKNATSNYKELSKAYKGVFVSSQPVVISTRIEKENKTFVPGEQLKFTIDYFNQSQEVLKNVEILASVDDRSNLLELESIGFVGGSRADINNNQIQWIGNNTPQLVTVAPQTRGKLSYTIKVKKDVLETSKSQAEYVLKPLVAIQAANLQQISQTGDLYKMRSNLRFVQAATESVKIDNKTQANRRRYKLSWKITNEQNEVDDIVVKAFTRLPPAAWQKTSVYPNEAPIEYNPNNGEITWKIPKLVSYTGIDQAAPANEVSFELEVELQSNNKQITLVEAPTITGKDNFTGDLFNLRGKPSDNKGKN